MSSSSLPNKGSAKRARKRGPSDFTLGVRERGQIETHQRLLDEGTRMFAAHGIVRSRANEIAQRAGVAVGTLYLHFGDKDGLVREILFTGVRELRRPLRVLSEQREATFALTVHRHIETLLDFVSQNPDLSRVMFHPEVIQSVVGADIVQFLTLNTENILRESASRAETRNDIDAAVAAQAIVGMQLHVVSWWAASPSRASKKAVADTLVAFYMSVAACR
jgi:AcrR family transcriptional regulator